MTMMMLSMRDSILAECLPLPTLPKNLVYQYVVAGNGLFVRAEDSRIEAMVPVAYAHNHGLETVEPYAKLKVPRVPSTWLRSILKDARKKLPNESMYQLYWNEHSAMLDLLGWKCIAPKQVGDIASLKYEDANHNVIIDLHSHGTLGAFFSTTDDADEQGFRFYVVIGAIDDSSSVCKLPQIACRVGVYGHHWNVPMTDIFDVNASLLFDQVDPEVEYVLSSEWEKTHEDSFPE